MSQYICKQGGKLVLWACKRAAQEAQQAAKAQWRGHKPSKPSRRHAGRWEGIQLIEDLLLPVDSEQEAVKQDERERILAYASADWKVSTLPKRHSCGPFGWPWRRKKGKHVEVHSILIISNVKGRVMRPAYLAKKGFQWIQYFHLHVIVCP